MKNLFLALVAVFAFSFASSAQSSDNGLIGRAKGAVNDCLQNAPNGWEIQGSVETVGICFVSGELKRVTLYAEFRCHSELCPKVMSMLIATVDFDCDGNISNTTCY